MLDFLFNLFKKNNALSHISQVTGWLAEIVAIFEQEYAQDDNAYNAAIDTAIQLLQAHKKPVSNTTPSPRP
jgi:hypothetical protein